MSINKATKVTINSHTQKHRLYLELPKDISPLIKQANNDLTYTHLSAYFKLKYERLILNCYICILYSPS